MIEVLTVVFYIPPIELWGTASIRPQRLLYKYYPIRHSFYHQIIQSYILVTDWLTTYITRVLQTLAVAQLLKKFTAFYETRKLISVIMKSRYWRPFWTRTIQSTPPILRVSDIHFHIILPLCLDLPNGIFPSFQLLTPSSNNPQEIFNCGFNYRCRH
jgi:hypothetical protein